jgi:alginate O-acetyltransferase complex protein AlgI
LVAGPIVRASELLPQLMKRPTVTRALVAQGLFVIATGMVKKIGVADYLAVNFVDRVFDDPSAYTSTEVMLALYGYTLQIYCDFSGYTDVARGSGMLFGLTLPENFDRPYQAKDPAEFWRRWHMTLSSWLRDYLYFPLGGSKVSPARAYFNLWITLFLIGLWHGAAWTFVIYGMLHATVMVGHRFVSRNTPRKPDGDTRRSRVIKVVATLHFVVLSRVFFRATDLGNARDVLERLTAGDVGYGHMVTSVWCLLVIGYVAHYLPRDWYVRVQTAFVKLPAPAQGLALAGLGGALLQVVSADVVPYIYLQF